MKQIEIKQCFLDAIRSGIKQFEIRKDAYLEGIVKLVVIEHTGDKVYCNYVNCRKQICKNCAKKCETEINKTEYYICLNCEIINHSCIKDSLIVNLTKRDMNTYGVGFYIGYYMGWLAYEYTKQKNENSLEILKMYEKCNDFLNDWTKKDDRPLYFYDLEIVKDKDYE